MKLAELLDLLDNITGEVNCFLSSICEISCNGKYAEVTRVPSPSNLLSVASFRKIILKDESALNVELDGVSIDSRSIKKQQLFLAIKGENFDGHNYILDAEKAGACAVICERIMLGVNIPQIIVKNSIQALAEIATNYRLQMSLKVIALTGSNGKTSVKEMISNILPKPSFATLGNLNNHIGVPLCTLNLKSTDKYAVFELGANHEGEIASTVKIVKPDVALINNIAPAHIAGFGSIEGVARAKGEIYQGLGSCGIAVVNNDDDYANFWDDILVDKKILRFSIKSPADIYAKDIVINEHGLAKFNLVVEEQVLCVQLKVPGIHNVNNAIAAAACTYALGISLENIVRGLEQFSGVAGRVTFKSGKKKSVIIDDTYNANLRSVLAALDILSSRQGLRILVLGDMGELGDFTIEHHERIGLVAQKSGIDFVFTFGKYSEHTAKSFGKNGSHYTDKNTLIADLYSHLDENTTVLVKGSRSSAMEDIVTKLI